MELKDQRKDLDWIVSRHLRSRLSLPLKCYLRQLMHWDTFKQNSYSTVGGDGGCRVGEVRAGTTSPIPDIIFCNCSGTVDELLESVQRRGFKIITGGIVRSPTIHLYNEVGLETLKARRDRNVLQFFFKIISNMVPDYLRDLKPEKSTPGRYIFRKKDEFVLPEWRLRTDQKSFLPFAVSLWNSLEEDTRTISNYELFKETLMGNVKDNPLFHLGTRQEQIIMARLRMRSSDLFCHLQSVQMIQSSACSCGFKNEDETHFFLACPLYYRPRVTLLNALDSTHSTFNSKNFIIR